MQKRFYNLDTVTTMMDMAAYPLIKEYYNMCEQGERFYKNPGAFTTRYDVDPNGWGRFDVQWEVYKKLTKNNMRNQD